MLTSELIAPSAMEYKLLTSLTLRTAVVNTLASTFREEAIASPAASSANKFNLKGRFTFDPLEQEAQLILQKFA